MSTLTTCVPSIKEPKILIQTKLTCFCSVGGLSRLCFQSLCSLVPVIPPWCQKDTKWIPVLKLSAEKHTVLLVLLGILSLRNMSTDIALN